MASSGQTRRQAPHSVQRSSMTAFLRFNRTAPSGQSMTQVPQPVHFSVLTIMAGAYSYGDI
jgi:hypothetical protein